MYWKACRRNTDINDKIIQTLCENTNNLIEDNEEVLMLEKNSTKSMSSLRRSLLRIVKKCQVDFGETSFQAMPIAASMHPDIWHSM